LALATKTAGIAVNDVGVFTRMSRTDGLRPTRSVEASRSGVAPTLNDEPPIDLAKPFAADPPAPTTPSVNGSLAAKIPLNQGGFRSRWLWFAIAFVLGGIATTSAWRVEHRGDADHTALIDSVRKAIGENRYVSPPGENVRDLLLEGLKRWPDDATLLELRSDAERAMVTRAMAAHSGGDVIGAYSVAQHALEIEPGNRSANLLSDEYGAEVRLLTSDASVITGSPCLLFDPPATATAGTTIDLRGRVMLRSAGAHAAITSPKITVREDRNALTYTELPIAQKDSSSFAAKLSLPKSPKKIYLTFEATVDGTLLRAERSLEVR
ncbi:MAG: hypothetical protein ABI183_14240, partial [Polyangiaceae bacterium]